MKKLIAYGCGGCALLAVLAVVGLVLWMSWVAKDPEGIRVEVEAPEEVAVGDSLTVVVTVLNERADEELDLTDIDVGEGYLAGFAILSTDPEAKSSEHVPIDDTRSFNFDRPVAAGESAVFRFELRAVNPGFYRDDIDVCEGARYLSAMVQTVVKE